MAKIKNPTNNSELIDWLIQNNPGVTFGYFPVDGLANPDRLFIEGIMVTKSGELKTKDGASIKFPEGFYYNEKNGITNKGNGPIGYYTRLKVSDIDQLNDAQKAQLKCFTSSTQTFDAPYSVVTAEAEVTAPQKKTRTTKEKVVDGAKKVGRTVKNAVTKAANYVTGKDLESKSDLDAGRGR